MSVLVIDDLRLFGCVFKDHMIAYAINSAEALAQLEEKAEQFVEIWLDHDLGKNDTVLPVINWIEEDFHTSHRLKKLSCIRILTNNPVGYQKIHALQRYVLIRDKV